MVRIKLIEDGMVWSLFVCLFLLDPINLFFQLCSFIIYVMAKMIRSLFDNDNSNNNDDDDNHDHDVHKQ